MNISKPTIKIVLIPLFLSGIALAVVWVLGGLMVGGNVMEPLGAVDMSLTILDVGDIADAYSEYDGYAAILLNHLLGCSIGVLYLVTTLLILVHALKLAKLLLVALARKEKEVFFVRTALTEHNTILYLVLGNLITYAICSRVTLPAVIKLVAYIAIALIAFAEFCLATYAGSDRKDAGIEAARVLLCGAIFLLVLRYLNLAPLSVFLSRLGNFAERDYYYYFLYPLLTAIALIMVRRLCKDFLLIPIKAEGSYYQRRDRWKKLLTFTIAVSLLHPFLQTFILIDGTRPNFTLELIIKMFRSLSKTWVPFIMLIIIGRVMDPLNFPEKEKHAYILG